MGRLLHGSRAEVVWPPQNRTEGIARNRNAKVKGLRLALLVMMLTGCVCYHTEGPLQWTRTYETIAGVPCTPSTSSPGCVFERRTSRPTTEAEYKASKVCEPWLPAGAPSGPPVICSKVGV